MTDSLQSFPSYETLCAQNRPPRVSPEFLRLRWKPFGPIETSLSVVHFPGDPPEHGDQMYKQGEMEFHPISSSSLTEPPISSITITQYDLNNWEDDWVECHLPHADYDGARWTVDTSDATEANEDGQTGDDEMGRKLMHCCGEDRPSAQARQLLVQASSKPYLTIHDYVMPVHAWLQTKRNDILRAKGVHEDGPVAMDTLFYVRPTQIDTVGLDNGQGRGDFTFLWWQVARFAARLGGAEGGFMTPAEIHAARTPNLQTMGHHPPQAFWRPVQLQWENLRPAAPEHAIPNRRVPLPDPNTH